MASRTSPQNGPGRYNPPLSTNNGLGPKMTRETYIEVGYQSNSLYYAGNLLCRRSTPTTPRGRSHPLSKIYSSVSTTNQNTQMIIKDSTGDMMLKTIKAEDKHIPKTLASHKRSLSVLEGIEKDHSQKEIKTTKSIDTRQSEISKEDKQIGLEGFKISHKPKIHLRSESPRKLTSPKTGARHFLPKKPLEIIEAPQKQKKDWNLINLKRRELYAEGHKQYFERMRKRPEKKESNSFTNNLYIRCGQELVDFLLPK